MLNALQIESLLTKTVDMNFYIFVNEDIKLRNGCMMAQVSHVTQIIVEKIMRLEYETYPTSQHCINYVKWKNGQNSGTTVVLKTGQDKLLEFIKKYDATPFYDNGELTCVGFFPGMIDTEFVKDYKLV
jgi:peptidyl-tRNA hydrolase